MYNSVSKCRVENCEFYQTMRIINVVQISQHNLIIVPLLATNSSDGQILLLEFNVKTKEIKLS